MRTIVAATRNKGKLRELRELLTDLPVKVLSLSDYPGVPEVEESGSSFAENAILKAETVSKYTGEMTLADDSGLEVEALAGRPGVYSARFAGPDATDEMNNIKLLREMGSLPAEKRNAFFRAVIAIAAPGKATKTVEGMCRGVILDAPQGESGFGYDPLFFVPSAGKTFAEMPASEKNSLSHRGQAMARARVLLEKIVTDL